MKLHRLEIRNIASLENAVVDFDAEPIAGADVFLITGPTGAGKSTILDAISIALYGRVPRLGSVRRNGDDFDNVSFNDVRQVLRQGTGKGEINLTFDGNDGCFYESHWTVRRAHDKPDRNFQNVEWTLVCNGDKSSALTKSKDIQPAIVKALGFDYDQFVRTSMLAQGEFTRFLKAGDSEKSEILTKLTRTEIYSDIGRRIFEITKEKKAEYDRLQAMIEGEHLLSDDERKQMDEDSGQIAGVIAEIQKDLNVLSVRLRWLGQWNMVEKQAENARKNLEVATEAAARKEISELRDTVAAWHATATPRKLLSDISLVDTEINDATKAIAILKEEYSRLSGAFEIRKEEAARKKSEVDAVANLCASLEWQTPAFARYEEIILLLDAIARSRERCAKENRDLSAAEKQRADDSATVSKRKETLAATEKKLEEAGAAVAEADKKVRQYDINALVTRQKDLQETINRCNNLKTAVERLAAGREALLQKQQEAANEAQGISVKEEALPLLQKAREAAASRSRNSEDLFKVLDFSHQRWASVARAGLALGCKCPVCLQTVEIMPPIEETLVEQWRLAARKAEDDRKALEDASKSLGEAEADLNARKKEYGRRMAEIEKDTAELQSEEKSIAAIAASLGLDQKVSGEAVDKMMYELQHSIVGVSERVAGYSSAAEVLKKAQKLYNDRMAAVQTAQNELHKADTALRVAEGQIESCRAAADNAAKEADVAAEKLRNITELKDWELKAGRMFVSVGDFKNYFTAAKHSSDLASRNREALRAENLRLSVNVRTLQGVLDSILSCRPEFENVASVPAKVKDIDGALARLSSRVVAENVALMTAKAKRTRYSADYEMFLNENPLFDSEYIRRLYLIPQDVVAEYEKRLREVDDTLLKARTDQASIQRQRAALMESRPDIREEESIESLESESKVLSGKAAELHSRRGGILARLKQNEETLQRVAGLKTEVEKAREEWVKWGVLNEHFGSATGDKFNRIAQSFVLRSLLERANTHLARLSKRYRLRGVDGQYIILLEDAENDYRCRPVVTGSGGETFLVSLSLALALAGEGRDVAADILFIDEGFGTLSGGPLQRAVALLRSLHSDSHKQVGIISHVEELKSEIPVQIQVIPDVAGASSRVEVRKLGEA